MSGGSRVPARSEDAVGGRGYRGEERRTVEARENDRPNQSAPYRSPVLERHGPLRGLTRGASVGAPEDFFSATQAGT
jgi:hypothetical protein